MMEYYSDKQYVRKSNAMCGVNRAIAMAAALLCLAGALAGCASSAAKPSGPSAETGKSSASIAASSSAGGPSAPDTAPASETAVAAFRSIENDSSADAAAAPILRCNFYNEKDFMASIEAVGSIGDTGAGNTSVVKNVGKGGESDSAAKNLTGGSGRIAGGVTPHHLLAAKMIAAFFRDLSADPPDTIVIIGPNHKRIGFSGIAASSSDWGTPFGRLEADRDIVKALAEKFNAESNDRLMQEDHSISGLIPYIAYYMPDVRIVPVLLHGNYPSADALRLGKFLGDTARDANGDIVIIASIDFSHYLDARTAGKMDEITWDAIKRRDIQAISSMGNDNLDSPPSIIALIGAMDKAGAQGPEKSEHSNSSEITGSGADYTTSYFTLFYRYTDK